MGWEDSGGMVTCGDGDGAMGMGVMTVVVIELGCAGGLMMVGDGWGDRVRR